MLKSAPFSNNNCIKSFMIEFCKFGLTLYEAQSYEGSYHFVKEGIPVQVLVVYIKFARINKNLCDFFDVFAIHLVFFIVTSNFVV